jgi:hypothetical protein
MIKLYFDIYFEFLKNSRFFWKSVYISNTEHEGRTEVETRGAKEIVQCHFSEG